MKIWLYKTEDMNELYFQGDNKIKYSGFTEKVDGETIQESI